MRVLLELGEAPGEAVGNVDDRWARRQRSSREARAEEEVETQEGEAADIQGAREQQGCSGTALEHGLAGRSGGGVAGRGEVEEARGSRQAKGARARR